MLLLFLRCIQAYFLLLITKKERRSCLVIPQFQIYGGTKTYFNSLIKFLTEENYRITVMLSANQLDDEIKKLQSTHSFVIEIVEFDVWRTRFQRPLLNRINKDYLTYQMRELIFFWKALKTKRASMLVCSISNPEELLFLFLSPIRVLYVLHTATMDRMDKFKRILLNICLSRHRQIVTVSNFAKRYVLKNWTAGKNGKYIQVVHNYYQPNLDCTELTTNGTPVILTIGGTASYKNPFFWTEVCKEVARKYKKPIHFIWAGDGPLLEECRANVEDCPQIKFIGFERNVENLYKNCSIYFQPSLYESHGIAVLGAMYHQKPCVVSNRGGMQESITNNDTGYVVDIDNIDSAVEALISLLKDASLSEEMGKKAKNRFDRLFTIEQWKNKMGVILN
ncbi:glycosyltransferase family 4 protein [Segetibacter aerophilus]|nr:glycosyltransferase family 4 protein [Segetibacter aerophilus]